MIEIILKILIAVFAVFGLYAFAHILGELCFQNDHIKLMIFIDSDLAAEQIDLYFEEAKGAQFIFSKRDIFVIIMEKYATDAFLRRLKQRGITWRIVKNKED